MRNSSYIENCKQLYSSLIAICEHLGIARDKSLLSVAKEKSSIQLARNKASYDEMLDNIVVIARRSNTHAGGRFLSLRLLLIIIRTVALPSHGDPISCV